MGPTDTDTVTSGMSCSMDSHGRPVRVFSSSHMTTFPSPGEKCPSVNGTKSGSAAGAGASGASPSSNGSGGRTEKLGTLDGVFLPCISNILGIILFLRLTNITGQAGTIYTTLIILLSTMSTFLTSLSLSAIATNGEIQAGGPYYVISRTLGIEIGATLGLLFYLGTTLATTIYVLGAVEALQRTIIWQFDARWASLVLMWGVATVVSVGVKYVNMASNIFLAMVCVSFFCMTLGCVLFTSGTYFGLLHPDDRQLMDNVWPHYQPDPVSGETPNFWSLLSIFYPSVTGMMAGCNRSAVLENPAKSIPNGTISAIGFTTCVYLFIVWLYGSVMSNALLIQDKFVVAAVAWPFEEIVAVGVIFSSIGAALQTCAGAPQVLAAIAMDDVLPFLAFLKPKTPDDEPKRAIWFTWLLATVPAFSGNLDRISPFVTMFFLLMYCGVNLSCFLLGFLKTPNFRPTFKYFHWSTSFLGFLWCLGLVGLVAPWYIATAVMCMFAMLYLYTRRQHAKKEWGDVGNALRYMVATNTLKALAQAQTVFHAKNWRPQVLTIINADEFGSARDLHVLALAGQLKRGGGGIHMVTSTIVREEGLQVYETCELMDHSRSLLLSSMASLGMDDCFAQVIPTTQSKSQALWSAVIHSGLGPLSPNTVLMPYLMDRDDASMENYLDTLGGIMNLKKAVVLFRGQPGYPQSREHYNANSSRSIDVWWVVHDGGLLLLLPYILSQNEIFQNTKLRLFAVTSSPTENPDRLRECVTEHLNKVRIKATVNVVDLSDTTIGQDMREADTVLHAQIMGSGNVTTHHMTVGEVFSDQAYEVPYHAVVEDMELGGIAMNEPATPLGEKDSMSTRNQAERMRTARAFNQALRHYSSRATLILTNLPLFRQGEQSPKDYFEYLDAMSESANNMLFVRGSGVEVITTYV